MLCGVSLEFRHISILLRASLVWGVDLDMMADTTTDMFKILYLREFFRFNKVFFHPGIG